MKLFSHQPATSKYDRKSGCERVTSSNVDFKQSAWYYFCRLLRSFSVYRSFAHFLSSPSSILTSFLRVLPPCPLPRSPTPPLPSRCHSCFDLSSVGLTHRVPLTVLPGLPRLAVPAVVEAISCGVLFAGAPGVSSLSPDHGQEGQPAQVHLEEHGGQG